MPQDRDLKLYTEDQVWDFVTKAIVRVLYDAIATHEAHGEHSIDCLLYTSPSPRDRQKSRMPSSA